MECHSHMHSYGLGPAGQDVVRGSFDMGHPPIHGGKWLQVVEVQVVRRAMISVCCIEWISGCPFVHSV